MAEPEPERPTFTITEAAEATATSRSTIRRRLDAGRFPNAEQDEYGHWRIPATDLLGAGLPLHRPGPSGETPPELAELDRMRAELAELRRRAEVAEALAGERERIIRAQERALRALEAGTGGPSSTDRPQEASGPLRPAEPSTRPPTPAPGAEAPSLARWWHRLRR